MPSNGSTRATRHEPLHVWSPLLTGSLRKQALETVSEIAESLRTESLGDPKLGPVALDASLSRGTTGLAILFGYMSRAFDDAGALDAATCLLHQALDRVASTPLGPGLYSGFTGVGWTIAHFQSLFQGSDDDDLVGDVDAIMIEHLSKRVQCEYDLIEGLVGIGVYALERLPRPGAKALLSLVLERIEEWATETEHGITWFSPPETLPPLLFERYPNGCYNLGMAHGVPGVVAFLSRVYSEVDKKKTQHLLAGAISWIRAHSLPSGSPSVFPTFIPKEFYPPPAPSRTAWCYGDPGVAAALLTAAHYTGDHELAEYALDVAHEAARRPLQDTGVRDAGLCHGSAGLAHIYNRMFQGTGDPELARAAEFWFAHTLASRQEHLPNAGYQAWMPGADNNGSWLPEPGFLVGTAGIALALLAAATPFEPRWDRVLLTSIPRRPW